MRMREGKRSRDRHQSSLRMRESERQVCIWRAAPCRLYLRFSEKNLVLTCYRRVISRKERVVVARDQWLSMIDDVRSSAICGIMSCRRSRPASANTLRLVFWICTVCAVAVFVVATLFPSFLFQEYEVLNLLGKGGYGSVYRAKCLRSGMEVAIKMVIYSSLSILLQIEDKIPPLVSPKNTCCSNFVGLWACVSSTRFRIYATDATVLQCMDHLSVLAKLLKHIL